MALHTEKVNWLALTNVDECYADFARTSSLTDFNRKHNGLDIDNRAAEWHTWGGGTEMGKRFLVFSLLLLAPLAFGAEKRDHAKAAATHHSAQKKTPAKGKKKGLKKLAFWHK